MPRHIFTYREAIESLLASKKFQKSLVLFLKRRSVIVEKDVIDGGFLISSRKKISDGLFKKSLEEFMNKLSTANLRLAAQQLVKNFIVQGVNKDILSGKINVNLANDD